MGTSTTAAAAKAALGGGGGIGDIASLINSLAPIFLGSGKTTEAQQGTTVGTGATTGQTTGTTAGTTTGTTTGSTVSGAAPNIISSMLAQMNTALAQATDPSVIQPIIDNIIQQAKIAFSPTLASLPSSGIYNSTSLGLLAGNAAAQAAAQSAATALNFRTNEQQIASNIGGQLLTATKTTDTTQQQQGATTQQTGQQTAQQTQDVKQANTTGTKQTGPVVSGALTSILGGAVGLPLITDQLGLTNIFGGKTPNGLIKRLTDSLGLTTPTAETPSGAAAFGIDPEELINSTLGGQAPAVSGFTSGGLATGPTVNVGNAATPNLGGSGVTNPLDLLANPAPLTAAEVGTPAERAALEAPVGGAVTAPAIAPTAGVEGPAINFTSAVPATDLASPTLENSLPGSLGAESTAPSTASGGGIDLAGLLGTAQSGFQDFAKGIFGDSLGGFLSTPAPGFGQLAGDVGNVFSSDFGSSELGTLAGDVGTSLASAGAGIGGSLLAGAIHKGNAIGSTVGSTIGGTAGSFFGPVGTFAGSFLGDLIGGLFGQQHPENPYFYLPASASGGRLTLGTPTVQNFHGNEFQTMLGFQQQTNALNQLLDKTGLKLDSIAGPPLLLGSANPHGNDPIPTLGSVGNAFSQFRFSADDPQLHNLVAGKSFNDPQALVAALQNGSAPAGSSAPTAATPPAAQQQIAAPQQQPTAAPPPSASPAAPPSLPDLLAFNNPALAMQFLTSGGTIPQSTSVSEHEGGGMG